MTCCSPTDKTRALAAIERLLIASTKTAVILEYAEALAPAGDPNFQSEADRAAIVTLHRWSFLPEIEHSDNVVILDLREPHRPRAEADLESESGGGRSADAGPRDAARRGARSRTRSSARRKPTATPRSPPASRPSRSSPSSRPPPRSESEAAEREEFIASILGGSDADERAKKLAALTSGLGQDEIAKLLAPGAQPASAPSPTAATARGRRSTASSPAASARSWSANASA